MESFDRKLKDKINDFSSEVDPEMVWKGIQQKRNKKRNKRRGFLLLFFATLSLLFLGLKYTLNEMTEKHEIDNSGKYKSEIEEIMKSKSHSIENNQYNLEKNENKSNLKNSQPSKKDDQTDTLNNDVVLKSKNENKYLQSEEKHTNNTEPAEKWNIVLTENEDVINESAQGDFSVAQLKTKTNEWAEQYQSINNDLDKIKIIFEGLEMKELSILSSPMIFEPKEEKKNKLINGKYSLAVNLIPNYVQSIYLTSDSLSNEIAGRSKSSEKYLEAFDVSALITRKINKRLSFGTGIKYKQYDTKFDYTYNEKGEVFQENAVYGLVINSPIDTQQIYRSRTKNGIYEVKEEIYNYRRTIQIPLIVTYNGNIKYLDYRIRASINFNIASFNKGRVVSPDGLTMEIGKFENAYIKNPLIGDLGFQFSGIKKYRNFEIEIGPYYNINITSFADKNLKYRQIQNSFGLLLGMKYDLR